MRYNAMHRLLQRQLKRYLKTPDALSEELKDFIKAVDNAYCENDSDRLMLDRAFDLSSQELFELNKGLKNALNRFELIVENSSFIAIQGLDRSGNIIHWNRACSNIYGYNAEETRGKRIQDILLIPEIIAEFEKALDHVYSTREPGNPIELEVKNKNGEKRRIYASMFPIIEDDKVLEIFCISLDITERKRLEYQLLQSQKMEALGTLAGGIAHDFNNLLMGIDGYAQIMMMDTDPMHPHYEMLKRIEMQVKSGADLSNQLLRFARGGGFEIYTIDLNETIKRSAQTFARTRKEISLSLDLDENLSTVDADRIQIEQVLLNLFVNSLQAMQGGGKLGITTENIFLNESFTNSYNLSSGQYIKISVKDNGTGMDKKTMDRIFEPFFTTKEMGRGTGLGLATVYGIVKAHKGIITVSSELNKGTTFNIFLPASNNNKLPASTATGSKKIHKGSGKVLIIDDEDIVLKVTVQMLNRLGYTSLTAQSGKEAIEIYKAQNNEIDLVILDMILPETGGEKIYNELQLINQTVKVLLASGYSHTDPAAIIKGKKDISFIQKPYNITDLSKKILDVLNGNSGSN
jgi:two-component system, cell cycle sensor histidine kinase and response regulator CckA